MRDLKNFKPTQKKEDTKIFEENIKENKSTEEDIQRMVDDRAGKSEQELMSELKSAVKQSKEEGRFSQKEMDNFQKTVSPFLTVEQKKKLEEILKSIQ